MNDDLISRSMVMDYLREQQASVITEKNKREFVRDPQNKKALDQMRQLLGKVRKVENRHKNRVYIPRIHEKE